MLKINSCLIFLLTFVAGIFFAPSVNAEIKIYDGTGEYIMGDFEKHDIAKLRAKERAIQAAKKKAGVFILSFSKSVNARLTENEILSVTSNLIEEVDVQYEQKVIEASNTSGIMYRATVKISVDTDTISDWLKLPENYRALLLNLSEEAQRAADENNKAIAELKARLKNAKTQVEREKLKAEITKINNAFLSNLMMDEGTQLFYKGNLRGALEKYVEAINLNPDNAYVYNNRGLAYAGMNEYEKALNDYNKALELNPNIVHTYVNRGLTYMELKNFSRAIEDFNRAIQINPNCVEAYNNRGLVFHRMKDYSNALTNYRKVLEINPGVAYAYNNIGTLYFDMKNYNGAAEAFNKAIAIKPDFAQAWFNHGNVYVMLKDYDQAIADYSKAIELNPNYVDPLVRRGNVYHELKQADKAIADYSRAIELTPNTAFLYFNRANTYTLLLGDYNRAIADYNKAIALEPSASHYYNRAVIYYNSGDYNRAVADCNKVLELAPDNAWAYCVRGSCYAALGNNNLAQADFAKARALGVNP